ncbi:hypothetical protein IWX64_003424 [Arthrobacter sp. CAN_A212]
MGDERELEPTRSASRIRFFNTCQWELFYENSGATDETDLGGSSNTDTYWTGSIDK